MRNYILEQTPLTIDEYEAIRLADYIGMEHSEAAKEMKQIVDKIIKKVENK